MHSFIARQPIFDSKRRVIAYELLLRTSLRNAFIRSESANASARVISDSTSLFGLDALTAGKRAFINLDREALLDELVTLLPADSTVAEILEMVEPDDDVLARCRTLKEQGYQIALDDFVYRPAYDRLIELVDIMKIDFLSTEPALQEEMVERFSPRGIHMLAEKVETHEDFARAQAMGYQSFQGYFFAHPQIVTRKRMPGHKLNHVRMLQELHRPDLDLDQLEGILKRDVSLSYKLLRHINSAYFSRPVEIRSVRHALVLLGEREFKKWASMVLLSDLGADKPQELLFDSIFTARFMEVLGPHIDLADRAQDLFLTGMFARVDAMTDQPLDEVVAGIPLPREIKAAIVDGSGPLRPPLEICRAYTRGQWQEFSRLAGELLVPEERFPVLFFQANEWVQAGFKEPEPERSEPELVGAGSSR